MKEFLVEYNKSHNYRTDDINLLSTLIEADIVYREDRGEHRWWQDWFYVVKVGDKFIGYDWATTTGDNSIFDMGWEFDWKSVKECEPKEVTKIIYVPKY